MEDDYGSLPMGTVALLSEKPCRPKKRPFPFGFTAPTQTSSEPKKPSTGKAKTSQP